MPDSPTTPDAARADDLPDAAARALPRRTIVLGTIGSALLTIGGVGGAGILVRDPILGDGPLSALRYGHGRDLSVAAVYLGTCLALWAWVRLGRHVLARRVGARGVLVATAAWVAPLLVAPPLFSRDVYSYLAQGALGAAGLNPYDHGPEVLDDAAAINVHYFWQETPAPYGPLFMLMAKWIFLATGGNMIAGVIVTRLVLLIGLGLLVWALPGLVRHLGGSLPVALWLAAASPMTIVHLIGGPHNDILLIGLMAAGTLLMLERRPVLAIVLCTLAVAIKVSAAAVLPFLVWMWVRRMPGSPRVRFAKALGASLGVFLPTFALITLVAGLDLGWIPALSAPSMIVNWMSIPTAIGMIVAALVSVFAAVPAVVPITVARILGGVVLAVLVVRQWWFARDESDAETVRRAAIVLALLAVLSPVMLPWYVTWSLALAAALPWRRNWLVGVVAATVWLVLITYPDGQQAMNDPLIVVCVAAVSALAAVSLVRPDPLRLSWRRRDPEPTAGPERPADTRVDDAQPGA